MVDSPNNWNEYSKLVLHELEKHGDELKDINCKLSKLQIEFTVLNTKAGLIGLIAGSLGGIVLQLIMGLIK